MKRRILPLMLGLQQDDPWSVPFREEVLRESLGELLVNLSAGRVFLICDADSCVGYVVLSFDFSLEYGGRNAWIDELFIRPGSGGWRNRSRNLRHGNGMQRLNPAMTAAVVALSPQRLTTYDLPRCCEPAALLTTSTC